MSLRNTATLASFFGSLFVKRWMLPNLNVRPRVAELFLTDNCNLRCISCACWRTETPDELSREEWYSVLQQLGDLGFAKLNFTGGEALLRPEVLDLVSYASKHTHAELHINTNGILLTPAMSQQLIDAGIRSFNVSFDGPTAEVHDHIRGQQGAFELTIQHFRELVRLRPKYNLKLRILYTVMRKNIDQLVDMAKLAQEMKVRLFFNVVTDHTFLFRGYNIVQLGAVQDAPLEKGLNDFLEWKREHPEFLPRYSVICYIGEHFHDQLQKELPCVEASLKLMVHSQGQVGGCWAHDPTFSVRKQSIAEIMATAEFKKTQTDLYFKRCKGCGANHSLNLKFDPRGILNDALWEARVLNKRRNIFA